MAPRLFRFTLLFTFFVAIMAALPAVRALADGIALPTLGVFTGLMTDGQPAELRGVYIPDVLADSVVQQPAGQSTFVSTTPDVLTQFAAASSLGSTGLLAHNYLAGDRFTLMHEGQFVYLVYGNGRMSVYEITQILQYQALQPESPYSNFVDLSNGRLMSAGDTFAAVYGRPGAVVFQTCIMANGDSSWGRLFVVAEPMRWLGHRQ